MNEAFRNRLQSEFDKRREKNARYSLRSFAMYLGADHSTLSQVLRGRRRAPTAHIRTWGKQIGLNREEIAAYIAAANLPHPQCFARENQLRHWTAEAMAAMNGRIHWQIWSLLCEPGFRNDFRPLAERIGTTPDDVNLALTRLLRLGLIETNASGHWVSKVELSDEAEFRRQMLIRIRTLS